MNTSPLASLLSLPLVDRTRRNHGLEHATISVLTQKQAGMALVGRSTPGGFYLYGQVGTEAVADAALEALNRLRRGEAALAVHPNCGTNFVTAGLAAGLAAYLGFSGANDRHARWERLPLVVVFSTLALILAQPLGLQLQRHVTTSGQMGGLQIDRVDRYDLGRVTVHFVATSG